MSGRLSPQQFQEAAGVEDWRVVFEGASAHFVTGSFGQGVALVAAIGTLAEESDHAPRVDLRSGSVTINMVTDEVGRLSDHDVALARHISQAARELGIGADPSLVQTVQITIDVHVKADVMPFWRAVLGYDAVGDEDLVDPRGRGPSLWLQQMQEQRMNRNRLHVDVSVPPAQAEARVAAAVAAGGRVVFDAYAPAWWTLADPEGNEVDVATWMGRD